MNRATRRPTLWRRLCSAVAVVSLALGVLEPSLPEIHAEAAQVVSTAPAQAPAPHFPSHAPGDGHALHVDHCGHSHFAVVTIRWTMPESGLDSSARFGGPALRFENAFLPAPQRPPIT